MIVSVRTYSDAATELAEAVRWYESKRSGLGAELLDEVSQAIDHVAQNPDAGSSMSADLQTRRLLVSRFPDQLVYRLRGESVVVAVAHLKRRAGAIQE